jgi:pimeloyl-ACP methyl ester carboxylesterase
VDESGQVIEGGARGGTLQLDGGHLAWQSVGSGPAVVLIHGFSLDRRMWDAVIPLLATDFTVVSYDLRGFGESSPMDLHGGYTHHDDLTALLDHLGLARATLVGFSFGGHVALTMAVQAPQRVSALVLVDALLEGVRWDADSTAAMHAVTTALHDRGIDEAKAAWLAHPFFTVAIAQPQVASTLVAMVHGYSGRHWLGEDPHRAVVPVPIDVLAHLSAPTAVVVGELDVPCFLEMSARLGRDIPGARLTTVPGSGHLTPLEAPTAVADAVRAAHLSGQNTIALPDP